MNIKGSKCREFIFLIIVTMFSYSGVVYSQIDYSPQISTNKPFSNLFKEHRRDSTVSEGELNKCYVELSDPALNKEKQYPEYWVDTILCVYTGNSFFKRRAGWHRVEFLVEEGGARWERRKPDNTVQAINANRLPPASFIYCLVKPKTISLRVVTDTIGREDFEVKSFQVYLPPSDLSKLNTKVSWHQVVCAGDRTNNFYDSILEALAQSDYVSTSNSISDITNALKAFQSDNNLAVGDFTKETLSALDDYLLVWFD